MSAAVTTRSDAAAKYLLAYFIALWRLCFLAAASRFRYVSKPTELKAVDLK